MYRVYALPLRQFAQRQSTASVPRRLLHLAAINEANSPVTKSEFYALTKVPDNRLKAVLFRNQISQINDALPNARGLPTSSTLIPALNNWFTFAGLDKTGACFSQHFRGHGDALAPYEVVLDRTDTGNVLNANLKALQAWLENPSSQAPHHGLLAQLLHSLLHEWELPGNPGFARFHAPLDLLDAALQYNTQADPSRRVSKLYVAQMPLSDLPQDLQRDLPVPALLAETPAHTTTTTTTTTTATTTPTSTPPADIYTSSIWLGLEPTFTPWHRDPNHNIFCQLHGTKQVRILPPAAGERLFHRVLNQRRIPGFSGSSAIRGEEMMHSSERQAWYDAVWGPGVKGEQGLAPEYRLMQHAEVSPRDMMFIPKGWWHSFVSAPDVEGGLNASVNWWFRWRRPS